MSRSHFRVDRIFHVDAPQSNRSGWYFEVSDGSSHGPYTTRALAGMALVAYLRDPEQTRRSRDVHRRDMTCHP
ncbi:MAG: DUF6316 family protein [Pseudomonadota bacterium]|jgi:hypothetical protein